MPRGFTFRDVVGYIIYSSANFFAMWTKVQLENTHNFLMVVFICSNCHIKMFYGHKLTINSPCPHKLNISLGKTIIGIPNLSTFQLLMCCVNLNIECLFIFLPQRNIG